MNKRVLTTVGGLVLITAIVGGSLFHWSINRVYVEEGYSLQLRYKGPLLVGKREPAKRGFWAEEGQIGVLQKLRGPGRHFYCPIWWERKQVPDILIKPGEVGVVTCKLGDDLPPGEFLVDGDIGTTEYKGILRKVLHPGRYRINPYGYEVEVIKAVEEAGKLAGWVEIPTGYVGVVTNLANNPETGKFVGVQAEVLPPGIYPINGREQQVDVVEIGYRHTTIQATKQMTADGRVAKDSSGEPIFSGVDSGIEFPSKDGFEIHMDFTAVWGLLPDQAPHAIRTIGNVDAIEEKIVAPQIASICRTTGSKFKAVELLVGADRETFQQDTLESFKRELIKKEITLLYGLVRHIYIPQEVRKPIQTAVIAEELSLTRGQEQLTAKAEASFREAEKGVELEKERVDVDTEKLFETRLAEGDREAKGIDAETERLIAKIEKDTAILEAQAVEILGRAENEGKQLIEEAKAGKFALAVQAFGTPTAYNNWVFATGLPDNVDLKFLYAGEGTLWTDMDNVGVRANIPIKSSKAAKK
jgi:regulator of protease activity HflC (stomatin/prohibitin superfamily)